MLSPLNATVPSKGPKLSHLGVDDGKALADAYPFSSRMSSARVFSAAAAQPVTVSGLDAVVPCFGEAMTMASWAAPAWGTAAVAGPAAAVAGSAAGVGVALAAGGAVGVGAASSGSGMASDYPTKTRFTL